MGEAGDFKIIRLGYLIAKYQNPNSTVISLSDVPAVSVESHFTFSPVVATRVTS